MGQALVKSPGEHNVIAEETPFFKVSQIGCLLRHHLLRSECTYPEYPPRAAGFSSKSAQLVRLQSSSGCVSQLSSEDGFCISQGLGTLILATFIVVVLAVNTLSYYLL